MRELLIHDSEDLVYDYMNKDFVALNVNEDEDEVAKVVAKYNLIAVPVIDDDDVLKGIITVDDAIDIILPTAWKKRIPRMFR